MPKHISKKLKDRNQTAAAVVALSTAEDSPTDAATLSQVMAEMGRKGGKNRWKEELGNNDNDRKKEGGDGCC